MVSETTIWQLKLQWINTKWWFNDLECSYSNLVINKTHFQESNFFLIRLMFFSTHQNAILDSVIILWSFSKRVEKMKRGFLRNVFRISLIDNHIHLEIILRKMICITYSHNEGKIYIFIHWYLVLQLKNGRAQLSAF